MQVLDYAAGYPGAATVRKAGYGGAVRYLRKEGGSWVKPVTAAERADYDAHGLGVALVYQAVATTRVLAGREAGQHDARWALARAAEIGIPAPRCVYFAVDADHPPAAVLPYFRGVADVLGASRTGAYGSYRVVRALLDTELVGYAWQTAAWSQGKREDRACLFQRTGSPAVGGIAVDLNDVLAADWGQHNYQQEDDMPTTQEIVKAVFWGTEFEHATGENFAGWMKRQAATDEARDKALLGLVEKVTSNPDVTRDEVAELLDSAVAEHMPTPEAIAAAQLPALKDAIAEVLAEDNAATAEEIADAVIERAGAKLSGGAAA